VVVRIEDRDVECPQRHGALSLARENDLTRKREYRCSSDAASEPAAGTRPALTALAAAANGVRTYFLMIWNVRLARREQAVRDQGVR
jgi:hypothetical protein